MKPQATGEVTADQAKEMLGVTTREAVVAMIWRGELPGAHKLEADKRTSPWLIPVAAIESLIKKRAQAVEA